MVDGKSKTFDKSKTAPVISPLSIFPKMLSVKWARAISVDNFGRKPNCFGVNTWFSSR